MRTCAYEQSRIAFCEAVTGLRNMIALQATMSWSQAILLFLLFRARQRIEGVGGDDRTPEGGGADWVVKGEGYTSRRKHLIACQGREIL